MGLSSHSHSCSSDSREVGAKYKNQFVYNFKTAKRGEEEEEKRLPGKNKLCCHHYHAVSDIHNIHKKYIYIKTYII